MVIVQNLQAWLLATEVVQQVLKCGLRGLIKHIGLTSIGESLGWGLFFLFLLVIRSLRFQVILKIWNNFQCTESTKLTEQSNGVFGLLLFV